jgi:hypothetical protein
MQAAASRPRLAGPACASSVCYTKDWQATGATTPALAFCAPTQPAAVLRTSALPASALVALRLRALAPQAPDTACSTCGPLLRTRCVVRHRACRQKQGMLSKTGGVQAGAQRAVRCRPLLPYPALLLCLEVGWSASVPLPHNFHCNLPLVLYVRVLYAAVHLAPL